jgi:hypothetical protein
MHNTVGKLKLSLKFLLILICLQLSFSSCSSRKNEPREEQIRVGSSETTHETDSLYNSIKGNISFSQISTSPSSVILTGLANHRLVTVYQFRKDKKKPEESRFFKSSGYYYGSHSAIVEHYMPGIDILNGFNLLSVAHFDLFTGKLNFLFDHPVLVKTLYYPSFVQDSLHKKPVNRNYFIVSVYDEDSNKDTLLNKNDLRRLFLFDANCTVKTQLIPPDYSVIRSQYDSQNDVMYVFARFDANKDGTAEAEEPIHVFWINLKDPGPAKRMY